MPLGIYISVPFCRTKCTYCNFASGVFSRAMYKRYVDRLQTDISGSEAMAAKVGAEFERTVDSIYLGGGTPTVLDPGDIRGIFSVLRTHFQVIPHAEITVECAPGTLTPEMTDALLKCGVNRVSLGVQSFVDEEARVVGRVHTRGATLDDVARLRAGGISNINVDLIAGLPHQSSGNWTYSLEETIATGVPHVSVYMLEIDEDSRLGRELIAGGTRYHAHFVPDEDLTADLYSQAVERLNVAGVQQYEISNFARTAFQSRHNLKYWTRQPYLGFGVDAHSMLEKESQAWSVLNLEQEAAGCVRRVGPGDLDAFRFSTPDSLDAYLAGEKGTSTAVTRRSALEEELFLGLRLNRGVNVSDLANRYSIPPTIHEAILELVGWGLLERENSFVRLTQRGRLLSNEVFQRFISIPVQ